MTLISPNSLVKKQPKKKKKDQQERPPPIEYWQCFDFVDAPKDNIVNKLKQSYLKILKKDVFPKYKELLTKIDASFLKMIRTRKMYINKYYVEDLQLVVHNELTKQMKQDINNYYKAKKPSKVSVIGYHQHYRHKLLCITTKIVKFKLCDTKNGNGFKKVDYEIKKFLKAKMIRKLMISELNFIFEHQITFFNNLK